MADGRVGGQSFQEELMAVQSLLVQILKSAYLAAGQPSWQQIAGVAGHCIGSELVDHNENHQLRPLG